MKALKCIFLLSLLGFGCGEALVAPDEPVERTVPPPASTPYQSVVVTGSVVNLRQGPGTRYAVVGSAMAGDTLLVTGEAPGWYSIYVPGKSLFAWVYASLTTGAELPRLGGIE